MKMHRVSAYALVALLSFALVGCDAGDATDDVGSDLTPTEDAAVSIANALGVESGGAFQDLAGATAATDAAAGRPASATGCERSLTYDEETVTWTHTAACERGQPDGRFYAAFSRTHRLQFLAGDAPQPFPAGATTLRFDIIEGIGERRTPAFHHVLDDLEGSFDIDGLEEDFVTINGTYSRAATDTLRTHRAVRTLDYTLDLEFIDVVGPRHREGGPHGWAESGAVEGHYQALVTFETRGGYREQEIDRTFTVVFGGDAEGPVLALGDRRFVLDLQTGTVDGVDMD